MTLSTILFSCYLISQNILLKEFVGIVVTSPKRPRHIESAMAIVDVEVIACSRSIVITYTRLLDKTQSLALLLLECNADHSLHACRITSARVLHYIDHPYLVRLYTGEFLEILYFSAIDIDLGITTAEDLHCSVFLCFELRNAVEDIRA